MSVIKRFSLKRSLVDHDKRNEREVSYSFLRSLDSEAEHYIADNSHQQIQEELDPTLQHNDDSDAFSENSNIDESPNAKAAENLPILENDSAFEMEKVENLRIIRNVQVDLQEEQEEEPLKYGDQIYIKIRSDHDQDMLLYSKGYTDKEVKFKYSNKVARDQLDLQKCKFEILPAIEFESEQRLRDYMIEAKHNIKDINTGRKKENEMPELSGSAVQENLVIMDRNIIGNCKVFKELIGKPIKYGSDIILMHTDSGMFLEVNTDDKELIQKSSLSLQQRELNKQSQQMLSAVTQKNYNEEDSRKVMNDQKHATILKSFLSPYISSKTQFHFEEFIQFQKNDQGFVYNQDLFYLAHSQTTSIVPLYGRFINNTIKFEDCKTHFLIQKVQDLLQNEENNRLLDAFQEFSHRFVWLTHIHDKLYLSVNEKLEEVGHDKNNNNLSINPIRQEQTKQLIEGNNLSPIPKNISQNRIDDKSYLASRKGDESEIMDQSFVTDLDKNKDQEDAKHGEQESSKSSPQKATLKRQVLSLCFKQQKPRDRNEDTNLIIDDYIRMQNSNTSNLESIHSYNSEDESEYSKKAIWFIEFKQKEDEKGQKQQRVYFKNIFYNKYLSIKISDQKLANQSFFDHDRNFNYQAVLTNNLIESECEFELELVERNLYEASQTKQLFGRIIKEINGKKYVLSLNDLNQDVKQLSDQERKIILEEYDPSNTSFLQFRDIFQLVKPTKDETWTLIFLEQVKSNLQNLLKSIQKAKGYFDTSKLGKILRTLSQFLQNKLEGKFTQGQKYGAINEKRQENVRTFNIMNIIITFLPFLKYRSYHKQDATAYWCTKKIFKILHMLAHNNPYNQLEVLQNFDRLKQYVSNSNKICKYLTLTIQNANSIIKKLVKATESIPLDMLYSQRKSLRAGHQGDKSVEAESEEDIIAQRFESEEEFKGGQREMSYLQLLSGSVRQMIQNQNQVKIDLNSIMDHFISMIEKNEQKRKARFNSLHFQILEAFLATDLDDGVFWNQQHIFKQLLQSKSFIENPQSIDFQFRFFIAFSVNKTTSRRYSQQRFVKICTSTYQKVTYTTYQCQLTELKPEILRLIYVLYIAQINCDANIQLPKKIRYDKVKFKDTTPNNNLPRPFDCDIINFIMEQIRQHFKQISQITKLNHSQLDNHEKEINYQIQSTDREVIENLQISNQFFFIIERLILYDKKFYNKDLMKNIFCILDPSYAYANQRSVKSSILSYDFQNARDLEISNSINQQYIKKLLKGEISDKFYGNFMDIQMSTESFTFKQMLRMISNSLDSSIATKQLYINTITQQNIFTDDLSKEKSQNLEYIYKIMNYLNSFQIDLFLSKFMEKYFSMTHEKITDDFTQLVEYAMKKTNEEYIQKFSFNDEEVIVNILKGSNHNNNKGDHDNRVSISQLLLSKDMDKNYYLFLELFHKISDLESQQQLIDLFFNSLLGKKQALAALNEVIIINTKEDLDTYKDIKQTLSQIRLYHQTSEVWLYNDQNLKSISKKILGHLTHLCQLLKNPMQQQKSSNKFRESQRSFVQALVSSLDGQNLILSMIKEYKSFISSVLEKKEHRPELESLFKLLYKILTAFVKDNEKEKVILIQHTPYFYPVSLTKNFGEFKFMYELMKTNVNTCINHFQYQILSSYITKASLEMKGFEEDDLHNISFCAKIQYLVKLINLIVKDNIPIEGKVIDLAIKFLRTFKFGLFKLCSSLTDQKFLKISQMQALETIFGSRMIKYNSMYESMKESIQILRPSDKKADDHLEKSIMVKINNQLRNLFISIAVNKFTSSKMRTHFEFLIAENLNQHLQFELDYFSKKDKRNLMQRLKLLTTQIKNNDIKESINQKAKQIYDQSQLIFHKGTLQLSNIIKASVEQSNEDKVKATFQNNYQFNNVISNLILQEEKKCYRQRTTYLSDNMVKSLLQQDSAEEYKVLIMIKKMIDLLQVQNIDETNYEIIQRIVNLISSLFDAINEQDVQQSIKDYQLSEFQKNLSCMDLTNTVLTLMIKPNHLKTIIYVDLLDCINKMLMGNADILQNKIYEYFMNRHQSEGIFSMLNIILKDTITRINDINHEIYFLDVQRFLEVPSIISIKSTQTHMDSYLLNNVIIFLKSLCEGHNTNHQNYLRSQYNIQNSNNFLHMILRLLDVQVTCLKRIEDDLNGTLAEAVHDNKDKKFKQNQKGKLQNTFDVLFETSNTCLVALLEMIQGPCNENQTTILNPTFRDITHKILKFNYLSLNMNSKNTSQKIQYLFWSQIYNPKVFDYRVMLLKTNLFYILIDLFEGTQRDENIIRIEQFLTQKDLEKNISEFYKLMVLKGAEYTEELFFNMNKSFDDIFEVYYQGERKLIKTKLKHRNSWMIIEVAINAEIIREVIFLSRTQFDRFGKKKQLQIANFMIARPIYNYLSSLFAMVTDLLSMLTFWKKYKIMKDEKYLVQKSLEFFQQKIRSIEISKDGRLETIYFAKLPLCNYRSKKLEEALIYNCDRTSHKTKVESLMNFQEEYILEMQSEALYMDNKFFQKVKIIQILALHEELFKDSAFYFLIAVHLYILSTYNVNGEIDKPVEEIESMKEAIDVTNDLVWVMVAFASFIFLFVVLKRIITISFKTKTKREKNMDKEIISSEYNPKVIRKIIQLQNTKILKNMLMIFISLFSDFDFVFYLLYIVFAILAILIHPFFLVYHLADIIIRSPLLKGILMAIYQPREQLLMTLVLFFVLEYVFALIAFAYLYAQLPEFNCTASIVRCTVIMIDQTFKNGGGIGGYFTAAYNGDFVTQVVNSGGDTLINQDPDLAYFRIGRFFYDNIFFILIRILIEQIISGIIIDTFSNLREKQESINQDQQNSCFICGLTREEIEKQAKSKNAFLHHTKVLHNPWNYIYYLSYLKSKSAAEYTGIESFIISMINNQDNLWLPQLAENDSDDNQQDDD